MNAPCHIVSASTGGALSNPDALQMGQGSLKVVCVEFDPPVERSDECLLLT